jgi:hypothetical protein
MCIILLLIIVIQIGCRADTNENKKADVVAVKYPELEIEGGFVQHLGQFESGQTVKKSISIKNISDAPLVFDEKIDTSCSCTDPSLSSYTVAAGESVSLKVSIGIPQIITDNAVISVRLRLLQPTRKYVDLLLTYTPVLKWSIEPQEIVLTGHAGDQFTRKFYFLQKSEKNAVVDSIKFDGFNFAAQNPKLINEGVWEINFSGTFPNESGRHFGQIKVTSNRKTEQINLLCYVRPQLTSIPPKVYIYLPTNEPEQVIKTTRTICVLTNQQFSIESAKMRKHNKDLTDIKWNLSDQLNSNDQNEEEHAQYMTVQFDQTIDITKELAFEVTIKTKDDTKSFSIPVIFVHE